MIKKALSFESVTNTQKALYLLRNDGAMVKHADANEWLPEIREFINNLRPKDNHIYTLCNALGAGEYWSSNVNGDYFPEKALRKYHNTFVEHAKPYMLHINKDPEKSYGEVLFSAFNPKMHRVELITAYDKAKLPQKYIKKIEADENVNLSMGCRVPYDVCSICGNVAPTPAQYCDCIKRHGLNHMYDDGRKLYVINTEPDFFDISIVIIPADKTARILSRVQFDKTSKTASVHAAKPAADIGISGVVDLIPDVDFEVLEKTAYLTKTPEKLAASIRDTKTYLKPHEVQAVLLLQKGRKEAALNLYNNKHYYEGDASETKVKLTAEMRGVHLPVPNRLKNIKQAMIGQITQGAQAATPVHGTIAQMTEIANAASLIGMIMGQDVSFWIPALLNATNIANNAITPDPVQTLPPSEDLMLAPLIMAKKASAMSTKDYYAMPILTAIQKEKTAATWEEALEDIITEGILRKKGISLIKNAGCT